MGRKKHLASAQKQKNDEFYTMWTDIEQEINKYLDFNPIYDKIILKKDYNKVTFTFIYPNGNPSANRWETFAEETHAREVSGTAKGDHLNTELINSDITEQAKKGYYLGSSNVESLTIKSIANLSKNIKFL